MTVLLALILAAIVAHYPKVSRIMTTLEKFAGLNTDTSQLLDHAATQAQTIATQAAALTEKDATIATQTQQIADLQTQLADKPTLDQAIDDLDARVKAALPQPA